MTRETYTRKHLIGGLVTVSEGESIAIMAGGMAADRQIDRHDPGAVAESLQEIHKQEAEE